MKTASCPSCGAPVTLKSSASAYVICEYCRSTLLRDGESLQNLGKMADLLDDPTLIQIGSTGCYQGRRFDVIGRIQLQHESGLWNEWHLLFANATTAWLSEAGGEYVLTRLEPLKKSVPNFDVLEPDMQFIVNGRAFVVTDLERARCIAGEGELPFRVESGYDVNTADLRNDDLFATLDYSETPPLFFIGAAVSFEELALANLKTPDMNAAKATVKAVALNCPHCGAQISPHSGAIRSLTCGSCASLIGVDNAKLQLLAKAVEQVRVSPWLPLGSKGRLKEIDWEVIGFLQRSTSADGQTWTWSEYLLFNAREGFAWLTEYDGHWCYARTLSKLPKAASGASQVTYDQVKYQHFSSSKAKVTYVLGEFYWRVSVGESCQVDDYIAPPLLLSREVSKKEASWSLSEYLEPDVVCAAFSISSPPPRRIGVYANQPNPLAPQSRKISLLFKGGLVLATVLQMAFIIASSGQLLEQNLVFAPGQEESLRSKEFTLKKPRSLSLKHTVADLNNDWVAITTTLVEKNTGQTYQGHQELAYFSGVDDGEKWSEGSRDESIVFKDVPAGVYYLDVDFEVDEKRKQPLNDTVEVENNSPGWSNYVMLLMFLGSFPLLAYSRRKRFETVRWDESDYGGGGDDDEEDD